MGPDCIFVYGTLKTGGRYHEQYCFDATAMLEASIPGKIYDLPVGYPAVIDGDESVVHGQLAYFPDMGKALLRIDELEDYYPEDEEGSEYLRVVRKAVLAGGEEVDAWVYVYPGNKRGWLEANGTLMADGIWTAEKCRHQGKDLNMDIRRDFFASFDVNEMK